MALDETIAANPEVRLEQLASIRTPKASPDDTVGHTAFLDLALEADLVELVSGVLGDNIVMWGVQLFCKPGDDGMEVPMYQDGQYWPIKPLTTCTLWLAIDSSDQQQFSLWRFSLHCGLSCWFFGGFAVGGMGLARGPGIRRLREGGGP